MTAPTGKLKFAYQTIANMESIIKELKLRDERILGAIKKCFPLPECTTGTQIVNDSDYNELVKVINDK